MLHLYLSVLVAVIVANVPAIILALALAIKPGKDAAKRRVHTRAGWSQLFPLIGSILPHWRIRPFRSMK